MSTDKHKPSELKIAVVAAMNKAISTARADDELREALLSEKTMLEEDGTILDGLVVCTDPANMTYVVHTEVLQR